MLNEEDRTDSNGAGGCLKKLINLRSFVTTLNKSVNGER